MQGDNRAEASVGTESIGTAHGAADAGPVRPLDVHVRPGTPAGTVVLVVKGELDYGTAAPLRDALRENTGDGRLVVDFSGLRFCDSTGLNLLLKARLGMLGAGGRLDLAGLRASVDRMFDITGARKVFRVYEDADDALADTGRTPGPPAR
ncbi:STAS domain-containing protein [Streptomyces sp. NPDC058664]|uniref:STAS domain-containing protein n=1 Tax=unclassified Streptomyces TaxID=2593676 RepID=UPI003648086D